MEMLGDDGDDDDDVSTRIVFPSCQMIYFKWEGLYPEFISLSKSNCVI